MRTRNGHASSRSLFGYPASTDWLVSVATRSQASRLGQSRAGHATPYTDAQDSIQLGTKIVVQQFFATELSFSPQQSRKSSAYCFSLNQICASTAATTPSFCAGTLSLDRFHAVVFCIAKVFASAALGIRPRNVRNQISRRQPSPVAYSIPAGVSLRAPR
jgi:hypothetical protein